MKVSIIMLHYDQYEEVTKQAIQSVKWALEGYYDYEILICDDNSSQYEALKKHESDTVKIFQCPVKRNQSMSRNICLKAATGDVFFCADGDDYFHVKGLREACRFIDENPGHDIYCSKLIKPVRDSNRKEIMFVQNVYDPVNPYHGVYGNMQHAFSVDYIRDNDYYWDEETYFWDSEDHYFNTMAMGNAKKILPIDTEYPIAIHPLYAGSNSDRDETKNPMYSLYMIRMNIDIYQSITCPYVKSALDKRTGKFLTRYYEITKYKLVPEHVQRRIDNKIKDTGVFEVMNVRDHWKK